MLCMHVMEYYPVIKRNEVLIYTTTWLNLENFMLNEISRLRLPGAGGERGKRTHCLMVTQGDEKV